MSVVIICTLLNRSIAFKNNTLNNTPPLKTYNNAMPQEYQLKDYLPQEQINNSYIPDIFNNTIVQILETDCLGVSENGNQHTSSTVKRINNLFE